MDFSAVQTPLNPLHTLHIQKFPEQHPLQVDTSLEYIYFNLVIFCLYLKPQLEAPTTVFDYNFLILCDKPDID